MLTTLGDGYVVIVRCVKRITEDEGHATFDTGSDEVLFWQADDSTRNGDVAIRDRRAACRYS